MRRIAILLLAGALALTGCAHFEPAGRLPDDKGFDSKVVRTPQPTLPNVFVIKGNLVVDQEPIRLWLTDYREGRVTIEWALAADSPTRWAAKGFIVFDPTPKDLKCQVRGASAKVLECSFAHEKEKKYKYTLTAEEVGKRLVLDPYIVNMQ